MSTAPVPPDGENPALAAIKTLGSKLCCYAGDWPFSTCDCKYGGPLLGRPGGEQTGCPELRDIYRAVAAGRAAASPDPRVPSGLPIGYGGPTVKSDPVALLAQVKAIVDEQLDEREGFGPWRRDQFMRIDALLRDVSPAVSPDPPRERTHE